MNGCSREAIVAAAIAIVAGGCSGSSSNPEAAFAGGAAGNSTGNGGATVPAGSANTGSGSSAGSGTGAAAALPPEVKVESEYQSPVATGNVVWIANPTSGRVAYIDAKSFEVKTAPAGDGPTVLAAVPDPNPADNPPHDLAIVLNVVSQDATLFSLVPPASGPDIDGQLTMTSLPATSYANAWAVSTSGRWAIAWTNTTLVSNRDPEQGYQSIEVLDVTGAIAPTSLSVGFLPVQMVFSGDETHAYAVTSDGITVIDLVAGSATANYPLGATPSGLPDASPDSESLETTEAGLDGALAAPDDATAMTASGSPDVSFTPDASYALVRQDGVQSLAVISMADGKTTAVSLPDFPTDLTMSPTGTFAVAVLRDTATVVVIPIPGIVSDPTSFTTTTIQGQTIGRAVVTRQGDTALLFTTAAPVDQMTVLTFQPTPTYRTIPLHAPVLAVFPTSDAQNAVVLHQLPAGSTDKGAFSVVPIASELPAVLVPLTAAPTAVALTDDRALVTIRDDTTATYAVYMAAMPSLVSTEYPLASPPLAVGIVLGASSDAGATTGATGYVAQSYSEGRITFIDLSPDDDGGSRTITGFDLNAGIVEAVEGTDR
jgi:hypothetical protein